MRVLVLDSGGSNSYHIMRTLALHGHEVHLLGTSRSMFFSSKYCSQAIIQPCSVNDAAFDGFLVDLVRKGGYGVLFFCGDDEAEKIWDMRDALQPHVDCCLADARWREVVFSKNRASRYAQEVGIPVPSTYFPKNSGEVIELGREVNYPVVVKGERGAGSTRVRYAMDANQLLRHYQEIACIEEAEKCAPSIQEYVHGPGYVVQALFHRGEPLAICIHRKDCELPVSGGVTTVATTVRIPVLQELSIALLKSMKWHGLAKMDFKQDDRDGRFKFLEIDARPAASIDITRAAGVDQPAMLCELAAGLPVQPRLECREGVRYTWFCPRHAIRMMLEPWRAPGALLSLLRKDRYCDIDPTDHRCAVQMLRSMLRKMRKQWQTRDVWAGRRRQLDIEHCWSRAVAM